MGGTKSIGGDSDHEEHPKDASTENDADSSKMSQEKFLTQQKKLMDNYTLDKLTEELEYKFDEIHNKEDLNCAQLGQDGKPTQLIHELAQHFGKGSVIRAYDKDPKRIEDFTCETHGLGEFYYSGILTKSNFDALINTFGRDTCKDVFETDPGGFVSCLRKVTIPGKKVYVPRDSKKIPESWRNYQSYSAENLKGSVDALGREANKCAFQKNPLGYALFLSTMQNTATRYNGLERSIALFGKENNAKLLKSDSCSFGEYLTCLGKRYNYSSVELETAFATLGIGTHEKALENDPEGFLAYSHLFGPWPSAGKQRCEIVESLVQCFGKEFNAETLSTDPRHYHDCIYRISENSEQTKDLKRLAKKIGKGKLTPEAREEQKAHYFGVPTTTTVPENAAEKKCDTDTTPTSEFVRAQPMAYNAYKKLAGTENIDAPIELRVDAYGKSPDLKLPEDVLKNKIIYSTPAQLHAGSGNPEYELAHKLLKSFLGPDDKSERAIKWRELISELQRTEGAVIINYEKDGLVYKATLDTPNGAISQAIETQRKLAKAKKEFSKDKTKTSEYEELAELAKETRLKLGGDWIEAFGWDETASYEANTRKILSPGNYELARIGTNSAVTKNRFADGGIELKILAKDAKTRKALETLLDYKYETGDGMGWGKTYDPSTNKPLWANYTAENEGEAIEKYEAVKTLLNTGKTAYLEHENGIIQKREEYDARIIESACSCGGSGPDGAA